jgi:Leucine Rich repeat
MSISQDKAVSRNMEASSSSVSLSSTTATAPATTTTTVVLQALYQTLVSVMDQFRFYAFGRNSWNGIDPNVHEAIYRVAQRQRCYCHEAQSRGCCEDDCTSMAKHHEQETLLISLVWALDQANMEYIVDFLRENNNSTNTKHDDVIQKKKTKTITILEFRLCSLGPGPASTAATLQVLSNFLQDDQVCKLQTLSLNFFPLGIPGVSQLLFPLFSSAASCNAGSPRSSINKLQLCNVGLHGVAGGECLATLLLSAQRQVEANANNPSNDAIRKSSSSTLQVLDCSDNPLGPDGAAALFTLPYNVIALRAISSTTVTFLKELNLARCSIGDRGIHLMARALNTNNTNHVNTNSTCIGRDLTIFNLAENQLTWECLTDLATILQCGSMTKLERLVLSGNGGLLPHHGDRNTTSRRLTASSMDTKRSDFWKALHQHTTLTRLALDGCCSVGDHRNENDTENDNNADDDGNDSFYTSLENDILRRNVYLKWANVLLRGGHHGSCATRSCCILLDTCQQSLLLAQGLIRIGQDSTMAGATAVFLMIQQGDIVNANHHQRNSDDGHHSSCNNAATRSLATVDDTIPKGRSDNTKAPQQSLCRRRSEWSSWEFHHQQHDTGSHHSSLGELLVTTRSTTTRTGGMHNDGRDDAGIPPSIFLFDPFGLSTGSWTDWIIAVMVVMAYLHLVTAARDE